MNKTLKTITKNGINYNLLDLPGTNYFKIELVNFIGSHIERVYNEYFNKNVYGISHFIEHLAFRSTRDYDSEELMSLLKKNGSYNASTDYDRINYWYQTSADRIDLGIRLLCNIAFNDLKNINQEEFLIERSVVANEARRYADDDQTMFYFNINSASCGYHEEDNVIGIPETIETFAIEDCIKIKDMFLKNSYEFNIIYDSTSISEDRLIKKIEDEVNSFNVILEDLKYPSMIKTPNKSAIIENESEQKMICLILDADFASPFTLDYVCSYIANQSSTSLNDLIREKNGLTYGLDFSKNKNNYQDRIYFSCDIEPDKEQLLLSLIKESTQLTLDNFSEEAYNEYIDSVKLKIIIKQLDQKFYSSWFTLLNWYRKDIASLENIYNEDMNKAQQELVNTYATYNEMKRCISIINDMFKNEKYLKITN